MKSITSLVLLFGVGSALATVPLSSVKRLSNQAIVPNKFIVEVENVTDLTRRSLHPRSVGPLSSPLTMLNVFCRRMNMFTHTSDVVV